MKSMHDSSKAGFAKGPYRSKFFDGNTRDMLHFRKGLAYIMAKFGYLILFYNME
jgi:hypothetical protein